MGRPPSPQHTKRYASQRGCPPTGQRGARGVSGWGAAWSAPGCPRGHPGCQAHPENGGSAPPNPCHVAPLQAVCVAARGASAQSVFRSATSRATRLCPRGAGHRTSSKPSAPCLTPSAPEGTQRCGTGAEPPVPRSSKVPSWGRAPKPPEDLAALLAEGRRPRRQPKASGVVLRAAPRCGVCVPAHPRAVAVLAGPPKASGLALRWRPRPPDAPPPEPTRNIAPKRPCAVKAKPCGWLEDSPALTAGAAALLLRCRLRRECRANRLTKGNRRAKGQDAAVPTSEPLPCA
jgi:hypothetical protein